MHALGARDQPRRAFEGPVGRKRQPKGVEIVGLPRKSGICVRHHFFPAALDRDWQQTRLVTETCCLMFRNGAAECKIEQSTLAQFATI
jgi:hypothetical protein